MSHKNGNPSPDPNLDALDDLGNKLEALRKSKDPVRPQDGNSGMAVGLKYASEFSAATMVGAFLGYGIDHFAKTAPWGLLIGLGLGFCAGVRTIVLSAQRNLETEDLGEDLPDEFEE